jgi:erythronate-4-phosphate dehydrogenase
MNIKIVADANIPYVQEAFADLGSVTLIPGRSITASHVRDAELLLVRSVTPVCAALLDGSRVRFVGSATIGVDHVDLKYLEEHRIAFAYAPGSNANSVAEYVIAAILAVRDAPLSRRTLGIIGLGRIGALVKAKAEALGMKILANDPPMERAGRAGLVALNKLLEDSDIVTCHVPLTTDGPDATFHLLNRRTLGMLSSAAILINTARGPVVENAALLEALNTGRLGGAVLDVWEREPAPEPELIKAVTLGTPHIAGYSFDGKVNGTKLLYEAACAYFNRKPEWEAPALTDNNSSILIDADRSLDEILEVLIVRSYDIRRDDATLRPLALLSISERGHAFDRLRAGYPRRMEFIHTSVVLPSRRAGIRQALLNIGFAVHESII